MRHRTQDEVHPLLRAESRKAFMRAGFCCEGVGSDGQRCGGTEGLSAHHIVKRSQGGADTVDNLRVLCIYCHRVEDP